MAYSGLASCAENHPTYYSPDGYASSCDDYVKDNAKYFKGNLLGIKKYYDEGRWEKLDSIKNNNEFNKYIEQLSECAVTYVFTNKINYFHMSHVSTLLFLDITNKPTRKRKSTERVSGIASDVVDEIDKILISEKIEH